MPNIKILPQEVYTRIAAGEVVERPSNVVKELIENSIDALSTEIIIEISSSGKKLIRIVDNGCGMSKEDLLLSVKPHATSKIEKFEDIYNLKTLGFRGEALASIANVSKLTIVSKTKDELTANTIIVHGGEVISIKECSGNNGTMVEVRDLFYNVPARLKFLKSDYTEKIHIIRTIEEYAIAYPKISFKFYSDNELVFSVSATDNIVERIYEVIKKQIAENLIYFDYNDEILKMYGFITPVEYSHVNKSIQMFYVNNRPITSRMLTQALYDAYRDNLPTGRHPIGIIFLDIPSDKIDVNVHPTKRIIKFYNEEQVYQTLKTVLQSKIKEYYKKTKTIPSSVISVDTTKLHTTSDTHSTIETQKENIPVQQNIFYSQTETQELQFGKTLSSEKYNKLGLQNFVYLGQLHRTYLLFETQQGLVLIDQHAASERVLYEKFLSQKTISVQKLLFPINIELKLSEFEIIKPYVDTMNNLGFEVVVSGKNSIGVYSIPSLFSNVDVKDFVLRFIENLISDIKTEEETTITPKERVVRNACRAAIKANDLLTLSDVEKLISDLTQCEQPYFCPHGRPTILELDIQKIEKLFLRRK